MKQRRYSNIDCGRASTRSSSSIFQRHWPANGGSRKGNRRDLWLDINLVNYRGHGVNCIGYPFHPDLPFPPLLYDAEFMEAIFGWEDEKLIRKTGVASDRKQPTQI